MQLAALVDCLRPNILESTITLNPVAPSDKQPTQAGVRTIPKGTQTFEVLRVSLKNINETIFCKI